MNNKLFKQTYIIFMMPEDEQITYVGKLERTGKNYFHLSVPDVPLFHLAGSREELERIGEPILAEMIHRSRKAGFPTPPQNYQGENPEIEGVENIPIDVRPRPDASRNL